MEVNSNVRIVAVPYDSGYYALRAGSGPDHLLANGLAGTLASVDREIREVRPVALHPERHPLVEVSTAFELNRLVSKEVSSASCANEFPLVLSGNCNTSVGTLSGVGSEGLGVVWFDGHADFNTPETTTSGWSDGMALAIAVGHCWTTMAESVSGFSPVAEENVVLVGVRDIDPQEQQRLAASEISVVGMDLIEKDGLEVFTAALDELRTKVGRVYVHLDLDVLDPAKVGRANELAPEGGLATEELVAAFRLIQERFAVAAASIASYDPAFDGGDQVLQAAIAGAQALTSHTEPGI